jgi:hypothetical protein
MCFSGKPLLPDDHFKLIAHLQYKYSRYPYTLCWESESTLNSVAQDQTARMFILPQNKFVFPVMSPRFSWNLAKDGTLRCKDPMICDHADTPVLQVQKYQADHIKTANPYMMYHNSTGNVTYLSLGAQYNSHTNFIRQVEDRTSGMFFESDVTLSDEIAACKLKETQYQEKRTVPCSCNDIYFTEWQEHPHQPQCPLCLTESVTPVHPQWNFDLSMFPRHNGRAENDRKNVTKKYSRVLKEDQFDAPCPAYQQDPGLVHKTVVEQCSCPTDCLLELDDMQVVDGTPAARACSDLDATGSQFTCNNSQFMAQCRFRIYILEMNQNNGKSCRQVALESMRHMFNLREPSSLKQRTIQAASAHYLPVYDNDTLDQLIEEDFGSIDYVTHRVRPSLIVTVKQGALAFGNVWTWASKDITRQVDIKNIDQCPALCHAAKCTEPVEQDTVILLGMSLFQFIAATVGILVILTGAVMYVAFSKTTNRIPSLVQNTFQKIENRVQKKPTGSKSNVKYSQLV